VIAKMGDNPIHLAQISVKNTRKLLTISGFDYVDQIRRSKYTSKRRRDFVLSPDP
jgi:hypothetical protein